MDSALLTTIQLHLEKPSGDILVFLTGTIFATVEQTYLYYELRLLRITKMTDSVSFCVGRPRRDRAHGQASGTKSKNFSSRGHEGTMMRQSFNDYLSLIVPICR